VRIWAQAPRCLRLVLASSISAFDSLHQCPPCARHIVGGQSLHDTAGRYQPRVWQEGKSHCVLMHTLWYVICFRELKESLSQKPGRRYSESPRQCAPLRCPFHVALQVIVCLLDLEKIDIRSSGEAVLKLMQVRYMLCAVPYTTCSPMYIGSLSDSPARLTPSPPPSPPLSLSSSVHDR
jgi:hypothetical protein